MRIEDEIDGHFRNEYHKGMINLIYTTNEIHFEFLSYLRKHSLTSQQYNVLRLLRGYGGIPRSIDFLRNRMLDKKSDMSRIIDRLYAQQLVDRVENNSDRRQKEISITQKGKDLLDKMDDCEKHSDSLLKNLTEEEAKELNRLLDKIRDKNETH
ncbi:MarR family winged helix-turn-helix transcriptional regulator [Microbacter margulisiae]|uniref:DNA-binding MarR family transcriptional regulator n=1 Tax=Microbacter margulisiae TaxID=1350067 RepID=A0A7W5H213_9PORP|nr:MarR family transcriptional regulator [Microbacter margulisiae]MBB3187250.1 DNA-binding MarR family transcriptional regulator [Microbacter margulisiae]